MKNPKKISRETFESTLIMMGWSKHTNRYATSISFRNLNNTACIRIQNAINTASLERNSHYATCRAAYHKILDIMQNDNKA